MPKHFLLLFVFLLPPSSSFAQSWPDVSRESEIHQALLWLSERGAVQPGKPFSPDVPLSRAAAAKMIVESVLPDGYIASFKGSSFRDVPTGQWYSSYVEAGHQSRAWETWVANGRFRPESSVTRGEFSRAVALAIRSGQTPMLDDRTNESITRKEAALLLFEAGQETSLAPATVDLFPKTGEMIRKMRSEFVEGNFTLDK